MRERLARLTSNIINPFLVSLAIMVLLAFRSAGSTPEALKWALLAVVLSVLPVFLVMIFLVQRRKLDGIFVNPRRQRYMVYVISSCLAAADCAILYRLGAPVLLLAAFVAGLVAMVVFMAINMAWKISLHTAFITASVIILIIVFGAAGAWSAVLIPPVVWARLELKHHTPLQVAAAAVLVAAIVLGVFSVFGLV